MAKKGEAYYRYSREGLSTSCPQISLLLETAVPLEERPAIMAEDTATQNEKDMLLYTTEGTELRDLSFKVMEDTGVFPAHVVRTVELGQQIGVMDQMIESLSDYHEKEYRFLQAIRNAVIYPVMMVVMFLVIPFVLFSRAMPVFNKVYEQLGTRIPPVTVSAMRLRSWLSGGAPIVRTVLALVLYGIWTASEFGKRSTLVGRSTSFVKGRSKITLAVANRRFTSVLAPTLENGMGLERGMDLARGLAENKNVTVRIRKYSEQLQTGESYYQAMKDTGLFSGFYVQMIKVEARNGHLDSITDEIFQDYEEMADTAIDDMITRFEPTIVAVLVIPVGLVLLSIMSPLVGVLSAIG